MCNEDGPSFAERSRQIQHPLIPAAAIVAQVWVDGIDVNREMVAAGMAWVYPQYCNAPECEDWRAAEAEAQTGKVGLWVQPNAVPPWEWRRSKRPK